MQEGNYNQALQSTIPACAEVMQDFGIYCSLSGSTAVVATLQGNCKLTVANLGDCRCFIGGVCKDGQAYSIPLTTDHTLAEPAEELRIRDCKVQLSALVKHCACLLLSASYVFFNFSAGTTRGSIQHV